MAFHYSPKIVNSGLVLYMDPINSKSYTGTGLTWSNLTSGSLGNLYGSSSYNSTTKSFDTNATAITNDYGIFSPSITFVDGSEYTLDFWVKLRSGATSYNSLCGRGATTQWLPLFLISTTSWFLRYRETSGTYNDFTSITDINLQNWTNITLVIKSTRVVSLYINGNFRESISTPISTVFNITRLASGYSSGGNYYPLQGSISATKIYNRSLSSTEVLQNFNALKSRFGL
jgi:hypothetical protein